MTGVDFEAGAILLIDKPAGVTSFAVVNRVRRLLRVKKVGHAGTLDPAATGLLILLTGKHTKHQDQFMGQDKVYRATVLFGIETDSADLDGNIIAEHPVPELQQKDIEAILESQFSGEFDQVPPAFSAIKVDGVRSYKRARQGKLVALKSRRVTLHRSEIIAWQAPEVVIDLHCSSGFYVRSLASDLGRKVGCGAALKRLIRTSIGEFKLEDAFDLDELAEKIRICRI
ncbi:tRNA pseudouridine(55) synthase TruB [bacterium]|nr:tRNA pseudouridine(55) synthase TruB [bacterium]MBU1651703.1 tRNA pseudouridine(55) synthase TruB [bacterium]MBU1880810.1 tRNA pseudouridine(55) synthase TruB [bacterium]